MNSQNSLPYPSQYYPGMSGSYSPRYPPPPPPPVVTKNPLVVWDPADKQRFAFSFTALFKTIYINLVVVAKRRLTQLILQPHAPKMHTATLFKKMISLINFHQRVDSNVIVQDAIFCTLGFSLCGNLNMKLVENNFQLFKITSCPLFHFIRSVFDHSYSNQYASILW
jgi:hypothetical protein